MGTIDRRMITKIHRTTTHTVPRCPPAVQNNIYMVNFVYESNLELERLAKLSHATEYNGLDRDVDGRRVFI